MRCYYHPDREIVATCTECGKGLCKECASKWDPILCEDCARERIADKRVALRRSISAGIVITALGLVVGIVGAISEGNLGYVLGGIAYGYMLGGIPNGWKVLNKIQPNMFLFLPLIGWVIYFLIKFSLAYFVGLVAFPVNIYRYWKGKKEADALEENLRQ